MARKILVRKRRGRRGKRIWEKIKQNRTESTPS